MAFLSRLVKKLSSYTGVFSIGKGTEIGTLKTEKYSGLGSFPRNLIESFESHFDLTNDFNSQELQSLTKRYARAINSDRFSNSELYYLSGRLQEKIELISSAYESSSLPSEIIYLNSLRETIKGKIVKNANNTRESIPQSPTLLGRLLQPAR